MPTVLGGTWSFFSIESVLWTVSQTFVPSAHTCTKQHCTITVTSFTFQKIDKGTFQQVTAFVKRM